MQFRDLKKQYQVLKDEIDSALLEAVADSKYIMGPQVKELERQLAEYVGVKHCFTCANGTDALTLALKAWGIGPGDAVFVPDFTFFSSAEVVALEGATPVFVDVREDTFNIDPDALESAIEAVEKEGELKPRVVIGVDLFGQPAEWPRITEIARRHGLLTLEDGAQGFGGSIDAACFEASAPEKATDTTAGTATGMAGTANEIAAKAETSAAETAAETVSETALETATGAHKKTSGTEAPRRACSFADIATTSFFPAKPLGCYGDGGAVFTDNDRWAALIESYRVHGKGAEKYDNVRIGLNSRLDTVQAAVLLVKLKAFRESELDAVNAVAAQYDMHLKGIVKTPAVLEGFGSSWAQYTIRLSGRDQRDALQAALKAEGIPSMIYYPKGMHQQTAFADSAYMTCESTDGLGGGCYGACPVTESLCECVLALPMHPYMTPDEITTVCDAVKRNLKA